MLRRDFTWSFQREGRTGAVSQQAPQALTVVRLDTLARIERLRVFAIAQSRPGERTQETGGDLGLNAVDGFGPDAPRFVEVCAACGITLDSPSTTTQWNCTGGLNWAPTIDRSLVWRYSRASR